MTNEPRIVVEGWVDKASTRIRSAETHLDSRVNWSEAIEDAQQAVELSVKSILTLLEVDFPRKHSWDAKALSLIASQIQDRKLIPRMEAEGVFWPQRLPRLLILTNFWATFYLPAKYGFEEAKLASPQQLFDEPEAKLALEHAKECHRAASELRNLPPDKLLSITQN